MSRPRWTTGFLAVAVGLGFLVPSGLGAAGPLRISNLVVSNTDNALSVNMVLLASLPDGVVEGLGTGIPAAVRFQVELWQYNSWWVDRRLVAKLVERQVVYDILTKEYRVSAVQGEEREPYVTRNVWEAERVLSEIRALRLAPTASLKPEDLYYVRVRAEVRSGAPDASYSKIIPFVSFRVETGWEQSPLLTLQRTR
ncbi:MAG: hypothetical protein DMD79_12150 [Candidatus Rokuibacteriota bacterium]|jgi:hypothetical protein|nr:MAG: hypothetical protein DMD79_12150 [Candidatus Rokubacteria bacterium]